MQTVSAPSTDARRTAATHGVAPSALGSAGQTKAHETAQSPTAKLSTTNGDKPVDKLWQSLKFADRPTA